MAKTFAQRLQDRIDADPDLTPARLATLAGLDNSTIRQFLSGKSRSMKLETAERIASALGTTLVEFMADPKSEEDRKILALLATLTSDEKARALGYLEAVHENRDRQNPPPR